MSRKAPKSVVLEKVKKVVQLYKQIGDFAFVWPRLSVCLPIFALF